MKKLLILSLSLLSALICSCDLLEIPTKDPELGEFSGLEYFIDMSQTNKFNESSFCKTWVLSSSSQQIYIDGSLESTADFDLWMPQCTFRKDHTMTFGDTEGKWLYSHNYILLNYSGGYTSYEVVDVKKSTLTLREEEYPVGGPFTPFIYDKSGEHRFFIIRYKAK